MTRRPSVPAEDPRAVFVNEVTLIFRYDISFHAVPANVR
jgi:hypothetical protein